MPPQLHTGARKRDYALEELNSHMLFIIGGPKTASTSLCGLVNSHADVFVMCEVHLNEKSPSRWAKKLLSLHRDLLPMFNLEAATDPLDRYRHMQMHLAKQNWARAYFGDKFATIDSGYSNWARSSRVIFTVRQLSEWLAKDSVQRIYNHEDNIVPLAVQYTKHFLESFLLDRVLHVRVDDFLNKNERIVDEVWKFLGLEPPEDAYRWWQSIGQYAPQDPKSAINWWRGHASSAIAPQKNDTQVVISKHPFWDAILPIFEGYYCNLESKKPLNPDEISADFDRLDRIAKEFTLSLADAYDFYESRSINPDVRRARRKRKQPWYSLGRLKSMIQSNK
jgi:hypothetical protein